MSLSEKIGYVDDWNIGTKEQAHPSHITAVLEVSDVRDSKRRVVNKIVLNLQGTRAEPILGKIIEWFDSEFGDKLK